MAQPPTSLLAVTPDLTVAVKLGKPQRWLAKR
jgi:hypothetical protein